MLTKRVYHTAKPYIIDIYFIICYNANRDIMGNRFQAIIIQKNNTFQLYK